MSQIQCRVLWDIKKKKLSKFKNNYRINYNSQQKKLIN